MSDSETQHLNSALDLLGFVNSTQPTSYYGPEQDGLGHKYYDVDPYIDFGNGLRDKTSLSNQQSVPMSKKVFGININVGPSKMIFGKLPSKTTQPKAMGVNSILGEKIRQAKNKFDKSQKICENDYIRCEEND